jgi:prepilin-type N-terminal cleavage/methylation domain-containing protein
MKAERGMTLLEMLIAMLVFSIVLGGALSVFRSQSRGFSKGSDRMTVLQNVRFATGILESDIRTAGSGVPDIQPFLVYADKDVLAFNSNYTSNVQSDVAAVYYDPDAPAGSVSALTKGTAITIPNSSFSYPDTSYMTGGINSFAETIIFFFTPDSSTARTDDYVLWRQVNRDSPNVVARNLLHTGSLPFFEYHRERTLVGGVKSILAVPGTSLPLRHSVPIHLSPGDTAAAAVIDSVRGVRVNLTATNGQTGAAEQLRTITRLVRIPNAGLAARKTCGDEPLPVAALGAVGGTNATGDPIVTLTWNQSIDESSGEKDVVRYVLWRRLSAVAQWGDPYLSIPNGNPNYVYVDAAVASGDQYMYAVAAQDCTPLLSALAIAGPVVVP